MYYSFFSVVVVFCFAFFSKTNIIFISYCSNFLFSHHDEKIIQMEVCRKTRDIDRKNMLINGIFSNMKSAGNMKKILFCLKMRLFYLNSYLFVIIHCYCWFDCSRCSIVFIGKKGYSQTIESLI
jgi:hypothetical protein